MHRNIFDCLGQENFLKPFLIYIRLKTNDESSPITLCSKKKKNNNTPLDKTKQSARNHTVQVKNFQSKHSLKLPDFSKFKLHLQKMPPFDMLISSICQTLFKFIEISLRYLTLEQKYLTP